MRRPAGPPRPWRTRKDGVAALEVGAHIRVAEPGHEVAQPGHVHQLVAADVDAPQQGHHPDASHVRRALTGLAVGPQRRAPDSPTGPGRPAGCHPPTCDPTASRPLPSSHDRRPAVTAAVALLAIVALVVTSRRSRARRGGRAGPGGRAGSTIAGARGGRADRRVESRTPAGTADTVVEPYRRPGTRCRPPWRCPGLNARRPGHASRAQRPTPRLN